MKRKLLLVLVFAIVFTVVGCGGGNQQEELRYVIADEDGDWGFPNPYGHYQRGSGYIRMSFLFDTLIWKDATGEHIPALSTQWEYSEEDNSYYFTLRDDVSWHDGESFSAQDVVFTFEYMQNNSYHWLDLSMISKISLENENQVKIALNKDNASFLNTVAGTVPILPEHIWSTVNDPQDFRTQESAVGTGPFVFVDYSREQGSYFFKRNENYYQGDVKVDELVFVRQNKQFAASSLRQGEINSTDIQPELQEDLLNEGYQVINGFHDWGAKLMLNHNQAPLGAKEFRQALAYAIDREELVEIARRGFALPGSPGLLPSEHPWYNNNIKEYNYNPDKTAEILEDLGYSLENGFYQKGGQTLELEILIKPLMGSDRDGEIIKEQLERVGIKVSLRGHDPQTVDSRLEQGDFQLGLTGHGMLGGDPDVLNRVILGPAFFSARYDKSSELRDALTGQSQAMDEGERKNLVYQVQEIYAEEMPALPLYYPNMTWAHDGTLDLFYTPSGVAQGIPIPLNKMAFIQ